MVPHSYQGKDGAFEGPQCNKILNSVESRLKPHLLALGESGKAYYDFLIEFKKFKAIFSPVTLRLWQPASRLSSPCCTPLRVFPSHPSYT